ncbi:T9SS type A sorting domain-containing protein [Xanthomarina sp. F2636L]|uniref:T9SS type A sorting domain-containing protein n=1 Tax=Xanthomarina sp. F2636L TaxID=2996018 RepID=UPI00225E45F8|nr:T9SS type A sorting domain-containing protein [Xanthomarina sp. F2636L]MCX7550566.1 T9SS type A sorting domain-containing protein [Xanthomarina sp. F2636L]
MKHFYLLLLAFLVITFSQAQNVFIPDTDFKNALVNTLCVDNDGDGMYESNVDTNNDGEIQVFEAEAVLSLKVSGQSIFSLQGIENFINLQELRCNNNMLTSLNVGGITNLERLYCYNNYLGNLNVYGLNNLRILECYNNELTTLDVTSLSDLHTLECYNNELTSLNVSGLTNLYYLYCSDNELTTLELDGLTNLSQLICSNNELTELGLSDSQNIQELWCFNNLLTELDLSGLYNLDDLVCSNNQITTLDLSGSILSTRIWCTNNQLTSLSIKNGSQIYDSTMLEFGGNPNLDYICVDDFELNNIQSKVNSYGYTNCVVNSYCSFAPGGDFYTIQGENKLDVDANGCNTNDPIFPNLKFNITDGSVSGTSISNETGNYSIPVQEGNHTITPVLENPTYFTITPTSLVVDFPTDASPYNQDFCLVPNGTYNDLEIIILPIDQARPGFDTGYKIIYKNKGNTELSGSVDLVFQDELMDLVLANPTADNQILNELSWNFSNLLPFESREITFTMNLNSPTDTPPLNGDDVLVFTATANPVSGDEMPDDNEFVLNQTVVNSFDPNDKTCLEGEIITPEQVGKFVHYMIRFENTGTADAVNIVVKDDIDLAKYDVTTLIPLSGSHDFVTRIKEDNVVEFIFENINLPFDDANNDGYVLFKIKTLPSLVLGDTFSNDAEIYFDYNAPIITNDELTTVAENLSIEESVLQTAVKIYPNPVSDELTIESKSILETISIFDVNGRQLQTFVIGGSTNKSKINISHLSKGVYFVSIKTEAGMQTSKIIKE